MKNKILLAIVLIAIGMGIGIMVNKMYILPPVMLNQSDVVLIPSSTPDSIKIAITNEMVKNYCAEKGMGYVGIYNYERAVDKSIQCVYSTEETVDYQKSDVKKWLENNEIMTLNDTLFNASTEVYKTFCAQNKSYPKLKSVNNDSISCYAQGTIFEGHSRDEITRWYLKKQINISNSS